MNAINLKNIQLKQKQQQRHSKQNVTITNLYTNKLVQTKPIFRVMPSIKPTYVSIAVPIIVESVPVPVPIIVESVPVPVPIIVESVPVPVPIIVESVPVPIIVESVPVPIIVEPVPVPIIVESVPVPIIVESVPIVIEESVNINNNFTLQYIKSKIMADYSNLYKSA
jgi:hypothetical protein